MKKIALFLILALTLTNTSIGQEWFSSLDTAKRMALIKNKMLLVIWEESIEQPYYVTIKDENGKVLIIDLVKSEELNDIIWEYFVPVLMSESEYPELFHDIENKTKPYYLEKLDDDSIKIMDANGTIVNSGYFSNVAENLAHLIDYYALNTTYLNPYIRNYQKNKNFTTSFVLGTKYHNYSLLCRKEIRSDIVSAGNVYFKRAKALLAESNLANKEAFFKKLELYKIEELLILNYPKKAKRELKKIDNTEVDKINVPLFNFLNYTTFILLKDEENAALWRDKLTQLDMKKASLILKAAN